jgi:hypothetical protein
VVVVVVEHLTVEPQALVVLVVAVVLLHLAQELLTQVAVVVVALFQPQAQTVVLAL